MLEKNLESCLNNSFKYAHSNKHEFVTTEHLLLSLLENEESLKVLASCNVDTELLKIELLKFIEEHTPFYWIVGYVEREDGKVSGRHEEDPQKVIFTNEWEKSESEKLLAVPYLSLTLYLHFQSSLSFFS